MPIGRAEKRARSARLGWMLALLMLLAGQWCLALPDDREQPIHISADEALRDEKQGVTVYSGNVQMNQGSMHIEADRVTIYHVDADADKIVARGRPAKMRQRPDLEKGPVHASALTIDNLTPPAAPGPTTDAGTTPDGAQTALEQRESGDTGTTQVDAGGEGGGIPADSQ